jgi:hypothetical protein
MGHLIALLVSETVGMAERLMVRVAKDVIEAVVF